ncbi:MAG: hypothetical protein ACRD0U_00030, partial [Acidimicrobiales bacterium]
GEPTGPFVEGPFATEPYDGLPCDGPDLELARQLLADGGYPDGFSIETIIITGESDANINLAQNRLFGFQRGMTVASRSQLGRPA